MADVRDAVLVAIVVAAVTAVCLWFLFRDGSMAHRAERDYSTDTPGTTPGPPTPPGAVSPGAASPGAASPDAASSPPADHGLGLGNTDDLA